MVLSSKESIGLIRIGKMPIYASANLFISKVLNNFKWFIYDMNVFDMISAEYHAISSFWRYFSSFELLWGMLIWIFNVVDSKRVDWTVPRVKCAWIIKNNVVPIRSQMISIPKNFLKVSSWITWTTFLICKLNQSKEIIIFEFVSWYILTWLEIFRNVYQRFKVRIDSKLPEFRQIRLNAIQKSYKLYHIIYMI